MAENSKVVWSEGMLLHPQHFQQHDRYLERLVNGRCLGLQPYDWGFYTLTIDRTLLKMGKFALSECQGIFPDGTPFNLPEDDDLPPPLDIPENCYNERVFLALAVRQSGSVETDSETSPDGLVRFRASEIKVRDRNKGAEIDAPLHIGKLKTRLMLEREERSAYTCLGVTRISEARADKNVIIDDRYIPANTNCFAMPGLGGSGGFLRELHGQLNSRGEELARLVANPGYGGVADIRDFLLLQLTNRYQPLFAHLADVVGLHPEDFYRIAIQLAGELATFFRAEKRPVTLPRYQHEDLQATFSDLMRELRQLLISVIEHRAIPLELKGPERGIYAADRPALDLLENATFVLAAHAQRVPVKTLERDFPLQVKICPVEEFRQLVNTQSPGIALEPLSAAPREIPIQRTGFTYFKLRKDSEHWKKMSTSRGFAIFPSSRFPGLEMEFWAIRERKLGRYEST
jgi:type VI secretion system protein ImpJ